MTEDQVVVGDEVEEPDKQLLCIVALRFNTNIHTRFNNNTFLMSMNDW